MSDNNLPTAFYRMLRLHQRVVLSMEAALQPSGLTMHQYTVLSMIRRFAPVSSAEIARKLLISAQSAGETIKSLEARELIARTVLPENRRTHALGTTAEGKRALARADKLVFAAEEAFFANLSPGELQAFERTIRRLRNPEAVAPPRRAALG